MPTMYHKLNALCRNNAMKAILTLSLLVVPSIGLVTKQTLYSAKNCEASKTTQYEVGACAMKCVELEECVGFSFHINLTCQLIYEAETVLCANPEQCYQPVRDTLRLNVENGLDVGEFSCGEFCAGKSFASGISVRELDAQDGGWQNLGSDDSAVNAVKLHCRAHGSLVDTGHITSHDGVTETGGLYVTARWIIGLYLSS